MSTGEIENKNSRVTGNYWAISGVTQKNHFTLIILCMLILGIIKSIGIHENFGSKMWEKKYDINPHAELHFEAVMKGKNISDYLIWKK